MKVDRASFRQRPNRIKYVLKHFRQYFGKKLLDVGCDDALLKKLAPELDYTGIDIGGTPDIKLDLEKVGRLPFEDNSFDCVLCADVLEHLDNLHLVFDELVRVSRRYLILSWPNNWVTARVPIRRGKGSFKFYGLPADRPADRHKWFFCYTDARSFVREHARRKGLVIAQEQVTEKPKMALIRCLRRLRCMSQDRYLNRFSNTYWTVIEKGCGEVAADVG